MTIPPHAYDIDAQARTLLGAFLDEDANMFADMHAQLCAEVPADQLLVAMTALAAQILQLLVLARKPVTAQAILQTLAKHRSP